MLLIRTAFKNILSGGKKTWLNVFVLSFSMVILIAFNGLIDGWLVESRRESKEWEIAAGQFWHPEYERYDIFSLQDAHGIPPEELTPYIENRSVVPVLIIQGSIYPQGRVKNIQIKGISEDQTLLKIPSSRLSTESESIYIPAIIGRRMAKSADLKVGDIVMMRWRDKNGVFDAREIEVVDIFMNKTPGIDLAQVWISLNDLREISGMQDEATILVKSEKALINTDIGEWKFKDEAFLLKDLAELEKGAKAEVFVVFLLLIALCLLAVFDTQTLSIFRRQKEIGTLVAMGMTPRRVMGLFTIEGTLYSILGVVAGAIWGTPLLWYLSVHGFSFPNEYEQLIGTNTLYAVYLPSSVVISLSAIILLSALISYLPTRKIARQNIVYALKGKIN